MNTTDYYFIRFTQIAKSCVGEVPVNQRLNFTKNYHLKRKKNE